MLAHRTSEMTVRMPKNLTHPFDGLDEHRLSLGLICRFFEVVHHPFLVGFGWFLRRHVSSRYRDLES